MLFSCYFSVEHSIGLSTGLLVDKGGVVAQSSGVHGRGGRIVVVALLAEEDGEGEGNDGSDDNGSHNSSGESRGRLQVTGVPKEARSVVSVAGSAKVQQSHQHGGVARSSVGVAVGDVAR
eukprot:TRINITY_DN1287_c0_g1_i2.p2 TRINITY_DN1287_c0_g1~~TRINITY_DN1287_c0_g1_i2.p2  ORF type:complete len:120 (-),score=4.95 TRINITY_DN1287_c0_g1_i2:48-407(-)